uniref:PGG domain-containing protein n=1 Tax=Fagus sylvatica TaxID=28930 RepID=A0A2N9I3Q8_FAGSY
MRNKLHQPLPPTTINMSGDTAFHVAVSVAPDHFVEELINIIFREPSSTQRMTSNKEGNTPLHVASSSGRLGICMRLAQSDKSLGAVRNRLGESPLFLAAFHGHKEIFLGLYGLCCAPNNNSHADQTPSAAYPILDPSLEEMMVRLSFTVPSELAFEILSRDDTLAYSVNEQGITPLHLLASKPSVFRSGCHLGWWKNIIYYCIHVEELKHETALQRLIDSAIEELRESSKIKDKNNRNFPKNYQACIDIYRLLRIMAQVVFNGGNVHGKGRNADAENPLNVTSQSEQKGKGETSTMAKTETPLPLLPGKGEKPEEFPLAINENGITEMVEQILEKFPIDINDKSKEISRTAKTETPLLLAARNGIIEMVEPILKEFPLAINEKSEVDMKENNALHLAAELGKQKPWLIPGAALQMQWEIKWYEGGEWLNKTSESCSVVAALIATVAFAASTTIPGDINPENGTPNLVKPDGAHHLCYLLACCTCASPSLPCSHFSPSSLPDTNKKIFVEICQKNFYLA